MEIRIKKWGSSYLSPTSSRSLSFKPNILEAIMDSCENFPNNENR